jgi:hypothetical protein
MAEEVPEVLRIRAWSTQQAYATEQEATACSTTFYSTMAKQERLQLRLHLRPRLVSDNRASRCLTNVMGDFIGVSKTANVRIKGIGDTKVAATFVGTVKWGFEDDSGQKHYFVLPDTYFSTAVPGRILSLQHWAQVAHDNKPMERGTYSATFDDCIELYWKQC